MYWYNGVYTGGLILPIHPKWWSGVTKDKAPITLTLISRIFKLTLKFAMQIFSKAFLDNFGVLVSKNMISDISETIINFYFFNDVAHVFNNRVKPATSLSILNQLFYTKFLFLSVPYKVWLNKQVFETTKNWLYFLNDCQ